MNFIDTVKTLLSNASKPFDVGSVQSEDGISENANYIQQVVSSGLSYVTRYTKGYSEILHQIIRSCSESCDKIASDYQQALDSLSVHGDIASSLLNVIIAEWTNLNDEETIAVELAPVSDDPDNENQTLDSSYSSLAAARKSCRDYLDSINSDWSSISSTPAVRQLHEDLTALADNIQKVLPSDGVEVPFLNAKITGEDVANSVLKGFISGEDSVGVIDLLGDSSNLLDVVESTLNNPSEVVTSSFWQGMWDKVSSGIMSVGNSARQWISTMKDIWTHDDFTIIDKFAVSLSVLTKKSIWQEADTSSKIATESGLSYGDVVLAGVKQSAAEAYDQVNAMMNKLSNAAKSYFGKAWSKITSWLRPSWVKNSFIELKGKGSLMQPNITLMSINSGLNDRLDDLVNEVSHHSKHNSLTVNNAYRSIYIAKSLVGFKPNGFDGNVRTYVYGEPGIDDVTPNPVKSVTISGRIGDGSLYGKSRYITNEDVSIENITELSNGLPSSESKAVCFRAPISDINLHIDLDPVENYELSHISVKIFRQMRDADVLDCPLSSSNMPGILDRDNDYSLVSWPNYNDSTYIKGAWTTADFDVWPDKSGALSCDLNLSDSELLKSGVYPRGITMFIVSAVYTEKTDSIAHYKIGVRHQLFNGYSILAALKYMYDLTVNASSSDYDASADNWSKIREYLDNITSRLMPISGPMSDDDVVMSTGSTPVQLLSWWLSTTKLEEDSSFNAENLAENVRSLTKQSDAAQACLDLILSQFWSSFFYDVFESSGDHAIKAPSAMFATGTKYLNSMRVCSFITLIAHPDAQAVMHTTDEDGDSIVPVLSWANIFKQLNRMLGDKISSARTFHRLMSNSFPNSNLSHDGIGESLNYIDGYTWLDIYNALHGDTFTTTWNSNYVSYIWDAQLVRSRYVIDDLFTYAKEIEMNRLITQRVLQVAGVLTGIFIVTTVVSAYIGRLSYVNTVQINRLLYDVDVNSASPSTYKHNNFKLQWRYRFQRILDGLRGLLNPVNWVKAVTSVTKAIVTKVSSLGVSTLKKISSVFKKSENTNEFVKNDLNSLITKLSNDIR